MDGAPPDLVYYKLRTVQISPKDPTRTLPPERQLRSLLTKFGSTLFFQLLCIRFEAIVPGPPNTVIVVFALQHSVNKILEASRHNKHGTLWQTCSIKAHTLGKKTPATAYFSTEIAPKLGPRPDSNGNPSGSEYVRAQPGSSVQEDPLPSAKRRRIEGWREGIGGEAPHTRPTLPPRTPCTIRPPPESSESMRARITQLEAELSTARNAHDIAVSEQGNIRLAHEITMIQKGALEAALLREQAEKMKLFTELEGALSQKSALSIDLNALRTQLIATEEKLGLVQSYSGESSERIKVLERELEEVQDQAHKLKLQNSRLEQQKTVETIGLNDAKDKLQQSRSEVEQLRIDLICAQEQLKATQTSLESMEQKYSSTHRQYEITKAKLGTYKSRLENEQAIVGKLKCTFTPEVYRSLGATYETLGTFLSITGLPPIGDEDTIPKKEESG